MNTQEFLDQKRSAVAMGSELPSGYLEQCRIALIEGKITNEEFDERAKSIPFCPN